MQKKVRLLCHVFPISATGTSSRVHEANGQYSPSYTKDNTYVASSISFQTPLLEGVHWARLTGACDLVVSSYFLPQIHTVCSFLAVPSLKYQQPLQESGKLLGYSVLYGAINEQHASLNQEGGLEGSHIHPSACEKKEAND